jgi:hypothetical protein
MTGIENASDRDDLTKAFGEAIVKEYSKKISALAKTTVDLDPGSDFSTGALNAHALAGPNSYSKMPNDIPVNAHPQTLKSCGGVSARFAKLSEVTDDDFVTNVQSVIRQQLAFAGARLSTTLNTIWP